MVVKVELAPDVVARLERVAPYARRVRVVERLVLLGLERAEQDPEALRPQPSATKEAE